jgi:hypothetical protein
MPATLINLAQHLDVPKKGTVVAAPTALTNLVTLLGGPARRLIVDTISGTLILTQIDGTTITLTENHLTALGGIVDHVCTAIQSAACTGILAQR